MGLEFRGPIPIPDMVATENMKHQTVNSQTRVSLIWQWRGQRKRKMSKTEKVQGVETGKGGTQTTTKCIQGSGQSRTNIPTWALNVCVRHSNMGLAETSNCRPKQDKPYQPYAIDCKALPKCYQAAPERRRLVV